MFSERDISAREVERKFERWEEWLMCILREGEIIWVFFFGFVRYTGIKDEEWLEKQLRNVWCG